MKNINDVAELVGVSIATVSRALSKPEVVHPETLKKIEAAVAQLNYHPNRLAIGLRRQRSSNIIIAVPSIFNPFTSAFVQGVENVAREAGYRVLLGITESDQTLLDSYVDMIGGRQADGLILLDCILPKVVKTPPQGAAPPPIVVACEYPPGLDIPRVRLDNVESAALVVRHLTKLGHLNIATIIGPPLQQMAKDRLAGFQLGLRRAGLELHEDLVVHGDFSVESGYQATKELLRRATTFTAVCCANDEMAIGALAALREAGRQVPAEVSVVGFDNLRFGEFASPPLTTVDIPALDIGEAAMYLMLDRLRDPIDSMREVLLPYRLITRDSSGPAPV
ncbi:MAG: LacI family DNA-binding transcriptional regulator [Pseudomonas sp.]